MKRLILTMAVAVAAAGGGWAQQNQPVLMTPDCVFYFDFTGSLRAPVSGYDNRINGCVTWTLAYYNTGFTGLLLRMESAPDNGGVAGTWVPFAGSLQAGVNPNTSLTNAFTVEFGYNPWVSVALWNPVGAGHVRGVMYGYRVPSLIFSSGSSGGLAASVNLAQVGGGPVALGQSTMAGSVPVVLPSDQSAITVFPGAYCNHQATITLSGAGNTEIIAASGTRTVYICHLSLSTVTGEDIKVTEGTGANCTTGSTDLTGLYKTATALALDFGPFAPLTSSAGHAVCINQSVGQATGGVVVYRQE